MVRWLLTPAAAILSLLGTGCSDSPAKLPPGQTKEQKQKREPKQEGKGARASTLTYFTIPG